MKKLVLGLMLILFMAPIVRADAPDAVMAQPYSGNTLVKATSGKVYSVLMTYIGATAGDYIQLIDSAASTGTVRFQCVAATTSGTCGGDLTVANYFGTAILYTEQKSTGAIFKTYIKVF